MERALERRKRATEPPNHEKPSRTLRIRLLGELQLIGCDGRAIVLPASKKTRALLGFLVATGQAHRRERLCDLLWDGPDDPRAELRWSLSKIRPLLTGGFGMRLAADRERVGIELDDAVVDLSSVRGLLGKNISAAPIKALEDAASQFGGEFLDGLDLPLCYRYQEWCMAEREAVSRLRLTVFVTLVERLSDRPADALTYARALATADPLSEFGHAAVVRLLGQLGRHKDALGYYRHAHKVLETELGVSPSAELEGARKALRSGESTIVPAGPGTWALDTSAAFVQVPALAFDVVGRDDERSLIQKITQAPVHKDVVLLIGEPGIGKSRMLAYIDECMMAAGGRAFGARAYEAEAARPYGVWIDILRTIARELPPKALPPNLALLLPEVGMPSANAADRAGLFSAVIELLRQVASERPTALLLDDVHWIDEASSSLLHYVVRKVDAGAGLLIACAARAGEIDDNAAASRVLRSLRNDERLQEIELAALSAAETAELVRQVEPAVDGARIFAESDGNPLFALELARANRDGEAGPGRTVEGVIAGQLALLTNEAREVVLWAAAHGRAFTPADLARSARLDAGALLMALGELERRGLLTPAGGEVYNFTHDLVRQTAYRSLSQPRRKLLHRHIARALDALSGSDHALAADIVHHAALAEDDELAAQSCVLAGEQALRVFANAEAASFAERGLRHTERLVDDPAKLEVRIALLGVRVLASSGPGMRPLPRIAETVAEATKAAEMLGLQTAAATGHYLLSVLHQEAGDTRKAERSTLRAAEAGRAAGDLTRAHQLANTARCLLELETGIGRSRELIAEASAIADQSGLDLCELHWARGLLERWDGREDPARSSIGRALALASKNEDRWREYKCLTWLAMLAQEMGQYAEMDAHCAELKTVAVRLGEDETPFVEALQALRRLAAQEGSANEVLEGALARLRTVDDKMYLAYTLNGAARVHHQAGRIELARKCATEALTAASIMRRSSEVAIAKAFLAAVGEPSSESEIGRLAASSLGRDELSARARAAWFGVEKPAIPTTAPTHAHQVKGRNRS